MQPSETERDIRDTALYTEAQSIYEALRRPRSGQISGAADLHASPEGRWAAFAGTLVDTLQSAPATRICLIDLVTGETRVITFGPNSDRSPRWSPDGKYIAFLSDRHQSGDYQLRLYDPANGAARAAPPVDGWVEYIHWSPDGARVLLGVAGRGADMAGGQGATTTRKPASDTPAWLPAVEAGQQSDRWRSVWIYEVDTNTVRQINRAGCNIWEASWCGGESIAAVVSATPEEGSWYGAYLQIIDIATGSARDIYRPQDQIGWPAASPSGRSLAIVQAICSDRGVVAGNLFLLDTGLGKARRVDTHKVDITYTEWRSERLLLVAGHRGFETVVGVCDGQTGTFVELWSSDSLTTGGRYAAVSGTNESGDCILVGESFLRAPEVATIRGGEYRAIKSFDLGFAEQAKGIGAIEQIDWKAPDGLEIQGWLLRPRGAGPYPLIMSIHGGPVFHWRPMWLGRAGAAYLMLAKRGYAIFFPNPRGSSGRGQDFARQVVGDMGGRDALDCLGGLDHLIEQKIADPDRLGVMGSSYGGFMTAWLITQDLRFAAAVAGSPVTNHVTQHLVSNIPQFVALFLADAYTNPYGRYFTRSPIMHAHKARTPTLNICGARDRCTPAVEAVQFHNALLEHGVESVLVTYPEEGHGVRGFPAAIDHAARVVGWFEEHVR